MNQRIADACVYPALFLTTTLYAVALELNKRYAPPSKKIEPKYTWAEVVVGDLICLGAGAIRAWLGPNDRTHTLRSTGLAFIVGGTPIITWQLWRERRRQRVERDTLQHYDVEHNDATSERPPAPLADLRQPGATAHRGNGRRPYRDASARPHNARANPGRGLG